MNRPPLPQDFELVLSPRQRLAAAVMRGASMEEIQRHYLELVLARHHGHVRNTAAALNVSLRAVYDWIRKLGIDRAAIPREAEELYRLSDAAHLQLVKSGRSLSTRELSIVLLAPEDQIAMALLPLQLSGRVRSWYAEDRRVHMYLSTNEEATRG